MSLTLLWCARRPRGEVLRISAQEIFYDKLIYSYKTGGYLESMNEKYMN